MPTPQEVIGDLIIGIDHIGLAVQDLDGAIEKWQNLFGARLHSREINSEQGIEEAMLHFSDGSQVQLLASIDSQSAISKFLTKHGEGVQQLALEVTSIAQAMQQLEKAQISSVYPAQKKGANGTWINFIHPKYTGGVLIELVEYSA